MPLKATGEDAKLLQPKFVLKNRVGEFKQEIISLADLQEFYSLNSIKQKPKDRPYAWSMTVGSLDGIISFKEKNSEGPEEIALKHIKNSGGGSDWRLLNAGWMFADAILATGSILRSEPEGVYTPHFEDLLDCRVKILKKKTRHPHLLVLTGTGNVELSHPCFNNKDIRVIILTTKSGEQHFKSLNELNEQKSPKPKKTLGERKEASKLPEHIVIEALETVPGDDEAIDFTKAFAMLRNKYDIQYLDVTAGGKTIAALMHEKLIDEFRLTIASQLIGPLTTTGETRPTVFHLPEHMHFTAENNPIVRYDGIRYYGYHHLFIRSSIFYRHGLEKASKEEEEEEEVDSKDDREEEEEEEEEKTEETPSKRKRGRPPVKSPKRESKKEKKEEEEDDEEEEEEREDKEDESENEEEEEEVVVKKSPKKTTPKKSTPSKRGRKPKR